MRFVKIYGLNRSGTNYVEWLIRNNFKDVNVLHDANILGWKHGPPIEEVDWSGKNWDDPAIKGPLRTNIIKKYQNKIKPYINELKEAVNKGEVLHVFVVKHPYSWYLSYDKGSNKHKLKLPLDKSKLDKWNTRNAQYLEYANKYSKNSIIIRYEDFYEKDGGFETVLNEIKGKFGLTPKKKEWVNQGKIIDPRQAVKSSKFNPKYYKDKLYLKVVKDAQKTVFKDKISESLLREFKYSL